MRDIIETLLNADVPTCVYVTPAGARAASAGTFITMAANVAAMAPGTNIGAAHPVSVGGELDDVASKKAENDAAALATSVARKRDRNEEWAEDAVRKSVSLPAEEALEEDVIDIVAENREELIEALDGWEVTIGNDTIVLELTDADIVDQPMSLREQILHTLSDPNVAYFLLILGFYGILYELSNPGFGFAGIGGAISLILGLYAFSALQGSWAGLALIALGFALLIAEFFTPTYGVLSAGGALSFIAGSLLLFRAGSPAFRLSIAAILGASVATGAFVFLSVGAAVRARRRPATTGQEGMVGLVGKVQSRLDPSGTVFVHGEIWQAESEEGVIDEGQKVRVTAVDGLTLRVIKEEGTDAIT